MPWSALTPKIITLVAFWRVDLRGQRERKKLLKKYMVKNKVINLLNNAESNWTVYHLRFKVSIIKQDEVRKINLLFRNLNIQK